MLCISLHPHVIALAGMFGFFFTNGPVDCFEDATKADTAKFGRFHRGMLERGVYLAPSAYEVSCTRYILQPVLRSQQSQYAMMPSKQAWSPPVSCLTCSHCEACTGTEPDDICSAGQEDFLYTTLLSWDCLFRGDWTSLWECCAGWLHIPGTHRRRH